MSGVSDVNLNNAFITCWNKMSDNAHSNAKSKGFWDDKESRNKAEMIALLHSELSEALEALRHDNPPDDKIPEFSGVEAEMADVLIRMMDFGAAFGYDIGAAVVAKMEYNLGRPHKHGKSF